MTPAEKLRIVARLQGELLREQRCGHPDWYAEMLFAAAYGGQLMPTNHPKYDMQTSRWGKVQVKCRVNGTDTTQNRSNFGRYALGDVDHAATVLFESDYRVLDALVLPCTEILLLVRPAGHVKWAEIKRHAQAVSVVKALHEISGEGRSAIQPAWRTSAEYLSSRFSVKLIPARPRIQDSDEAASFRSIQRSYES